MNIKRFSLIDRLFHIILILTFLLQTATGLSRLYHTTPWGKSLGNVFGGYEACSLFHRWGGIIMAVTFVLHVAYILTRINRNDPLKSISGPDSIIPNLNDFKQLWQNMLWHMKLGPHPKLKRWTYWEKFDYWAVFWGVPLLTVTGLMLMYPMATCRYVPGWTLNIAALLHKAEAILAVTYIFIVHFFAGHLRPNNFPMNEAMFSGTIPFDDVNREKPDWIDHLRAEGKLNTALIPPPKTWLRYIYYAFGYTAIGISLYLLINAIIYSRYITFH